MFARGILALRTIFTTAQSFKTLWVKYTPKTSRVLTLDIRRRKQYRFPGKSNHRSRIGKQSGSLCTESISAEAGWAYCSCESSLAGVPASMVGEATSRVAFPKGLLNAYAYFPLVRFQLRRKWQPNSNLRMVGDRIRTYVVCRHAQRRRRRQCGRTARLLPRNRMAALCRTSLSARPSRIDHGHGSPDQSLSPLQA